jgi:glutamyl-tRNA synthetase
MPEGREVFSLEDMIREFSWDRVTTGGPVFDLEKLAWLNGEYMRAMPAMKFVENTHKAGFVDFQVFPREKFELAAPMFQERVKTYSEVPEHTAYFISELPYEPGDLLPKKKDQPIHTPAETREILLGVQRCLTTAAEWTAPAMEESMRSFCETYGWKTRDLFMTLRVAITGRTVSTPLFETMAVLGRDESMNRLAHAIAKLA